MPQAPCSVGSQNLACGEQMRPLARGGGIATVSDRFALFKGSHRGYRTQPAEFFTSLEEVLLRLNQEDLSTWRSTAGAWVRFSVA
jgi:hypothetical protein